MSTSKVVKLFPEQLINHLIQIGDTERPRRFKVGDIRNSMAQFVHEFRPDIEVDGGGTRIVTIVDVDLTVAMLLKQEFSVRSIQRYALVAECIPIPLREKYEQLPFSHFDLARQFGENAETILRLSMQQFAKWGRPPSREALLSIAQIELGEDSGVSVSDDDEDDLDIAPTSGSLSRFISALRSFLDHKLGMVPVKKQARVRELAARLLEELDEIMQPVV